ncbi:MAG: hypothetical protein Q9227_001908 [Pyrenula ochraceoflavens]
MATTRRGKEKPTSEDDLHLRYGSAYLALEQVTHFSQIIRSFNHPDFALKDPRGRRSSHDDFSKVPKRFILDVESTRQQLLDREDTDGNMQISIDDDGPKFLHLGTANSGGFKSSDVRGVYRLGNLLQELTIALDYGKKQLVLDEARINENPVDRLSRFIRDMFWENLTRRIDGHNIEKVALDTKDRTPDPRPRVYIPRGAPEQHEYYAKIAAARPEIRLDVQWLPENEITAAYVRDLNDKPGLLALAMEEKADVRTGEKTLQGLPFLVPGGRFNELYGWDSYMESIGLLIHDRIDLCKSMVENFCFCIKHYGKILNANRSYYLCRSQPPFLTDMALRVYDKIKGRQGAKEFLRIAILAAIKEYYSVWMALPRYDPTTGLSRYRPDGIGVPPETEASHFVHLLTPYAKKHNLDFGDFVKAYNRGEVEEPDIDDYFLHDRAVRESGHDTSYRLENVAADLATVDLNSCLYKYETDIAGVIRGIFDDQLEIPVEWQTNENRLDMIESSAIWDRRARKRQLVMEKLMWDKNQGMYFDYNTAKKRRQTYECATTFWPMWAHLVSPEQAAIIVAKGLPKFESVGGIVSGTERSRGEISLDRPSRQWDYPFGWAPQQMLAWQGFLNYGYRDVAQNLAYKWLYMVTKAFVDFNGVVVEKYDVTQLKDPHKVEAEYGNQGADFKGAPREGFGWVNASYVYGLTIVNAHARRALSTLTPFETWRRAVTAAREADLIGHLQDHLLDNEAIEDD